MLFGVTKYIIIAYKPFGKFFGKYGSILNGI